MKLFYITSGFRRPIDMIDNGIIKALLHRNELSSVFQLNRMDVKRLLAEVKNFSPDIVLTLCGPKSYLPIEMVRGIRKMRVPVAVWFVDDPYAIDNALEVATEYDYVFSIDSGCVPYYQEKGCERVYHLPLGTDPDIFNPFQVHPTYHSDICFVGTGYKNRLHFFDELFANLSHVRVNLVGHFWEQLTIPHSCDVKLRRKWINSHEAARYYNGAKIVLNIHRSHDDPLIGKNQSGAPGFSINNRTFDITACRSFQLIDYRPDLELFFRPVEEIDFFESPKECADKIQRYLLDSNLREQMTEKAFRRTLENHTFLQRLEFLCHKIQEFPIGH